jgi:hypothetical protein
MTKTICILIFFLLSAALLPAQSVTVKGSVYRKYYQSQQQVQQANYRGSGYWVNDTYGYCPVLIINLGSSNTTPAPVVKECDCKGCTKTTTNQYGDFVASIKAKKGDKIRVIYDCDMKNVKESKISDASGINMKRFTLKN